MNFQQLRYLNEISRCGLNIPDAAKALHTSQPGMSKQIKHWTFRHRIEKGY